MTGETKVIISGFKFEKIEGKRILHSVYLLDTLNGDCIPVPISNYFNVDKEELAKELVNLFRSEIVAMIDVQNDPKRPNSNYVNVSFVGIKNN